MSEGFGDCPKCGKRCLIVVQRVDSGWEKFIEVQCVNCGYTEYIQPSRIPMW